MNYLIPNKSAQSSSNFDGFCIFSILAILPGAGPKLGKNMTVSPFSDTLQQLYNLVVTSSILERRRPNCHSGWPCCDAVMVTHRVLPAVLRDAPRCADARRVHHTQHSSLVGGKGSIIKRFKGRLILGHSPSEKKCYDVIRNLAPFGLTAIH